VDLENLLYRIINGYYYISIDNIKYKIISPDINIKQQAHNMYLNTIDEHKYDINSWISDNQIQHLLHIYGIWNKDLENKLNSIVKDLEKTKIELYKNFYNSEVRASIKQLISNINNHISDLHNKKYYFDYLTLEYYAQNIKNQYLITNMVYDIDGHRVFKDDSFENINYIFLEKILYEIHKHVLDTSTIKQIVRSELWKSYWNVSKESIFPGTVKDWTDEQRSLVNFSKVLDSIREHMEAPSDEIMMDDDALDGWILYQNHKNETEKKKQQISDKFSLDKKRAGEVFLLTNNSDERQEIYGLNDTQTNKDIKEMIEITQKEGKVNWTDLPHVKREIKQQLMAARTK
jgi:hypothetical protein